MTNHLPSAFFAAGAALLVVACGRPVGVTRVSPQEVSRELTQSALNSSTASLFSQNVLHRWNLTERFRRDPAGALASLHQLVIQHPDRQSTLLAELSFSHADATRDRGYYFESAICVWAFLFPGRDYEPPDELDPRLRIATDRYNRALTQAFAAADGSVVDLRPASTPCPSDNT
jgi:hypothetical protein